METTRQVNRLLHDEHMHVQRLLDRLGALVRRDPGAAATALDGEVAALFGELAGVLGHGLERHFRFEEQQLFPRLAASGEGEMAALLHEDHEILLPLAAELRLELERALTGGLGAVDWRAFRRLALTFVERQTDHIEKEEFALLPALEAALDEAEDRELGAAYLTA